MNGPPVVPLTASHEAGTELLIDSVIVPTIEEWEALEGSFVQRLGDIVFVRLLTNEPKDGDHICTLPADFLPPLQVDNAVGTLRVEADGKVVSLSEVGLYEMMFAV